MFWKRLPIEKATSLFYFYPGSETANIIYDMKYHNNPTLGVDLGRLAAERLMAEKDEKARAFFDGIQAIVPIPLARKRLRNRGYNQSLEIAKGLSQITHIPILTDVVRRTTFQKSQTHLTRSEKQTNVEGAFTLLHPEKIQGKHILIVDDIITTGATIIECGQELCKATPLRISVFSLGLTRK